MTDRDNIELPPLPSMLDISGINAYAEKYARAAVLADRERRAEQAKPAKLTAHSVTMKLQRDGCAWRITETASWIPSTVAATVTLCWTDDGRAWIESEHNRELAKRLRYYASTLQPEGFRWHDFADAADALDRGVR